MAKLNHITLPDEAMLYIAAQIESGRFASIDEALAAGVAALREYDGHRREWLAGAREQFLQARAAFDRGEGITTTPDDLMDAVEADLGWR